MDKPFGQPFPDHTRPAASSRGSRGRRALRAGLVALAAAALLAVLYVGYWLFAINTFRDAALAWVQDARARGFEVRFRQMERGGFPLWVRLGIEQPSVERRGANPWSWHAPSASVTARPWRYDRITLNLAGTHRVTVVRGGAPTDYTGTVRALTVAVELSRGQAERARVAAEALTLAEAGMPALPMVAVASVRLGAWRADAAGFRDVAAGLAAEATGVTVPAHPWLPHGAGIARVELEARLLGPLAAPADVAALAAWRDTGGTVEVDRVTIVHGPLSLWASGTLALDGEMQPIGAFTAKTEGFLETIEALRRQGVIQARDAVTATIVLGALATRPADGGRPSIALPVTVQDRKLYAGPVVIARLPAIEWGGGWMR